MYEVKQLLTLNIKQACRHRGATPTTNPATLTRNVQNIKVKYAEQPVEKHVGS
jgi:hypothetical protein